MPRARLLAYAALAAAGIVSPFFTKIALFVLVLTLIAALSLPRERPRALVIATALAGLGSGFGFVRFLIAEAVPGIVQGGTSATQAVAVSRLREILFAEDTARRHPIVDPDRDGIGSAALLGELTGAIGVRGGARLVPPALERYALPVETALGPAIEMGGYFFVVCLPRAGGGFTARPGEPVDEELAERRYVAYAWPSAPGRGLHAVYFMDEHERILVSNPAEDARAPKRVGPGAPPACDEALGGPASATYAPWRGKRARGSLPGDRP